MAGSSVDDTARQSPRPQPDALRRVARSFRQIGERLVRIAGQMEEPEAGLDSLRVQGARAGQLLVEAAKAGAGHPFDEWASGAPAPAALHQPPTEADIRLWWVYWHMFTRALSVVGAPFVPGSFERPKTEIVNQDKAQGITMVTFAFPVTDPVPVWRDRIEDHASLCTLLADELEALADRTEAAAEADRRALADALDRLEALLDDRARRREFGRRVEELVGLRWSWIVDQCAAEIRAFIAAGDAVHVEREKQTQAEPAQALPSPSPLGNGVWDTNAGSLFAAMLSKRRPRTPLEAAQDEAGDRWNAARREAEQFYDRWAREHAAESPLCFAFLRRWHALTRPGYALLPELVGSTAQEFDPTGLPASLAAVMLATVERELAQVAAKVLAEASKPDGWTKEELCTQGEISEATFDRIREAAEIPAPQRGDHGFRYGPDDLLRLIAAAEKKEGKRTWAPAAAKWRSIVPEPGTG